MSLPLKPSQLAGSPALDAAAGADHRIANNLSIIASLIRMRGSILCKGGPSLTRQEVGLMLGELGARLDTVARLHRLLAGAGQGTPIDIAAYLREVAEAVVSSLAVAGSVELRLASDAGCFVTPEAALSLGLIAGEMVTNAVKYAHPTGVAAQITLACRGGADGSIAIEVSDDGVGLPEGLDPMKDGHLGFRLVRSLAEQLGAAIAFHSGPLGLCFELHLAACSREQRVIQ
jgi:two-component sensor histidine kinase